MRSLMPRRSTAKSDPAPSRWAWRMQRLMLTPGFRLALRAGVPFCVTLMAGLIYLSDADRRAAIAQAVADTRASIQERPEFMVKLMAIDGVKGQLAADIRALMPFELPQSSFDMDLELLRSQIVALPGIKAANVRIRPGGILHVDAEPRVPVAIWRTADGLMLIDEGGAFVASIDARADFPQLPLLAGEGPARHVPQALRLVQTGQALGDRMRGLVRRGDRRWDVVLDRDQRILLPEVGAVAALERVIALEGAQEVLTRDVVRVDMRLRRRPTIQMSEEATQQWWQVKQVTGQ
jgi:cell division protein FtsQ